MKNKTLSRPNSKFYISYSSQRGQSTLEIIIALTLLTAGITSAVFVVFGGQSLSTDAEFANKALRLAETEIEFAASRARYDFAGITSGLSTVGDFTKEVTVVDVGTSTKRITSRVTWRTDPLRLQEVELVTLVTDWKGSEASGGDTGGGGLSGDWNNPRILGAIDLGAGISATDLDVINKMVYMSGIASAASKSDFFIVNATDGESTYVVSNLDTGLGLNSLDVTDDYAYGAHDKTSNQLQIIDISNKANPVLVAEYNLPEISGAGAVGWSIFFHDNKIYIGTKNATGPEFHVIDVSDPLAPSELGGYEVGADVNGINVSGNTAYLATSDNAAELLVLNVGDPGAITQAGVFDAAGSSDAFSVYLRGTNIYLGRDSGSEKELLVLDVTSLVSISALGSTDISDDVNGITVRDHIAFITTSDPNKEFQVWNISDPANITNVSTFNFPNIASGIDYEDNLVYVAVRSNDSLRIITSQ